MRVFTIVLAALLCSAASAWSINGHLIVANVALNVLEDKAPASLKAANKMLTHLAAYNDTFTTHEKDHAFVETATFADDMKYHGEMWQSDFHFKKIAWIEEGKESDYDIQSSPRNISVGLDDITSWLSGKRGDDYKDGYMYTFLMKKFDGDENVAKSYALRLLIHYMGDIVQPFHSEYRYNSEYPAGDKGANSFPLPNHYGVSELHALFDEVLYTQHKHIDRPFTAATWESFQGQVADLMETYGYAVKDAKKYKTIDYDAMTLESFKIAKTLYTGVTENEKVPQEYLDKNIPLAYERLVLGGYRLYYTIDFIFGSAKGTEEPTADNEFVNEEPEVEFLQ